VLEQLLEDDLAGGKGLGRRLRGLELCALGCDRSAQGRYLGGLALGQVGGGTRRASGGLETARPAIVAPRPILATRSAIPITCLLYNLTLPTT
jgi:hypothetical protein